MEARLGSLGLLRLLGLLGLLGLVAHVAVCVGKFPDGGEVRGGQLGASEELNGLCHGWCRVGGKGCHLGGWVGVACGATWEGCTTWGCVAWEGCVTCASLDRAESSMACVTGGVACQGCVAWEGTVCHVGGVCRVWQVGARGAR